MEDLLSDTNTTVEISLTMASKSKSAAADGSKVPSGRQCANGVLGLAVARALAADPVPYTAIFTVRSIPKSTCLESILSPSSQKHLFLTLDLSSLASVSAFASSLSKRIASGELPKIQALICAAGVMQVKGKQMTGDGMEATFQINYLSNFLLIILLLPVMRKDCRTLFLTSNLISDSGSAQGPPVVAFGEYADKLPDSVEETGRSFNEGTMRYARSKMLLSMFAIELQNRLDASSEFGGISVVSLDPGSFISGMINEYPPVVRVLASYAVPALSYLPKSIKKRAKTNFTPPKQAANYVLELALDKEDRHKEAGGKMYAWDLDEVPLPADARNQEHRRELWRMSIEWARLGEHGEKVPLS